MKDHNVNTTIEIFGKHYSIRCEESLVASLQEAAVFFNQKMHEVQSSGTIISLERIAIIAGLHITHQFLQLDQQKKGIADEVNHRIFEMNQKLDKVSNQSDSTAFEVSYSV